METLFALINNAVIAAHNSGAHPWVRLHVNTKNKEIIFWSQSYDSRQQIGIDIGENNIEVTLVHYGDMEHIPDEEWVVENLHQLVEKLSAISNRWHNISYLNQYVMDVLIKLTNGTILEGKK